MGGQPPLPTGESMYALWHIADALERDFQAGIALQPSSGATYYGQVDFI